MSPQQSQPYLPPRNVESQRRVDWVARLVIFVWIYLAALVACFYATWLCGWAYLGHPPRPSLDDPKSIGPIVDILYLLAGTMLVAAPGVALAGILITYLAKSWSIRHRVIVSLGLLTFFVLIVIWFRIEPLDIMNWYFD